MAAKGAIAKLFDPLVARLAPAYQAAVGNELRKVGLRYEDLYDPEFDLDTAEALRRLPPEEVHARNQRLKRGLDMSMKHSELPHEIQEQQTPFNSYLAETLAQVKAENEERKQLGSGRPYDRHLP